MNFLGHLYFSGNDTELMAANLFGDFVKGKDLSAYSAITQKGIVLHRAIDQYIDHHPDVLELMHQLYPILPKVTGIAVDLYFDHLLAKNWAKWHTEPLADYVEQFYHSFNANNPDYSEHFTFLLEKMREKNWLYQYQYPHGLWKACQGVSGRISFKNSLTSGLDVFQSHEKMINDAFEKYMADAIPYFQQLRSEL